MKGKLGIFLLGVLAAFLLDPVSGSGRRSKVGEMTGPALGRIKKAKDQVADSDVVSNVRENAGPTLTNTLQNVANGVQGRIDDAASMKDAVQDKAESVVSKINDAVRTDDLAPQAPQSIQELRASITPSNIVDPIPEHEPNDPTLVARVESELFRDDTLPKGKLNIDAANGVITLRGTVGKDLATDILERVRAVEGVDDVVDLLHRG